MPEKKIKHIQTVKLTADEPVVHCPYCGVCPAWFNEASEPVLAPCPHTLFVAHDDEFVYCSPACLQSIGLGKDTAPNAIDTGTLGVDGFTSALPMPAAVKFALYAPPPSFFGVYIGFDLSGKG